MENRIFSKVGIILAAMVLINTALQAQNWLDTNSITMHSTLSTDCYAQKVKPYQDNILIGLSNIISTDRYCFSIWENDKDTVYYAYLNSPRTIVSDFAILDNMVYFCGTDYSQGSNQGFIGRFNVDHLLSNGGNLPYEITYIANTANLTKIVAYRGFLDPVPIHIAAIGNDGFVSGTPARFVCMDNKTNNSQFRYSVLRFQTSSSVTEILDDITFDDKYVITAGRMHPQNEFVIRYFLQEDPLDSYYYSYHWKFTLQNNAALNTSYYITEFPVAVSTLPNSYIAIASSMTNGQNFFTMVNVMYVTTTNIQQTQMIPHDDKDNRIIEMEYSNAADRLLVLNNSTFTGSTKLYSTTFLNLSNTTQYSAQTEYLTTLNEINHLSVFPERPKYITAGIDTTSSSNQLISVRNIQYDGTSCYDTLNVSISGSVSTQANISNNIATLQSNVLINWISDSLYVSTDTVHIDCEE